MSDGNLSMHGEFRILVIDPDGSIAHDTGPLRNVITKIGMQFLLYCIAGNDIDVLPTGGAAGIDNADFVVSCALGDTGAGVTKEQYYDAGDLWGELGNVGYARELCNRPLFLVEGTIGPNYTDQSSVVFKFKFEAGAFADGSSVDEVGLMNHIDIGTGDAIACKNFVAITTNSSQEVQVFYTITLEQAA